MKRQTWLALLALATMLIGTVMGASALIGYLWHAGQWGASWIIEVVVGSLGFVLFSGMGIYLIERYDL